MIRHRQLVGITGVERADARFRYTHRCTRGVGADAPPEPTNVPEEPRDDVSEAEFEGDFDDDIVVRDTAGRASNDAGED